MNEKRKPKIHEGYDRWRTYKYVDIIDYEHCRFCYYYTENDDFESVWGSVRENRNLVHYLLKYRFLENWDREVRENYFGLSLERLLSKIPMDKYEIVYFEDYILPYTVNKIKEDFDIELHDNTHVKLLLKKRDLK